MPSKPISTSAAIDAIRRRAVFRAHADTPALRLLAIEDKMAARIAWRERTGRDLIEDEKVTLDGARNEIDRRSKSEMEIARVEFRRRNKLWSLFPDEGPYKRSLYPKHMQFIGYTKTDEEILCLAGNRVGKSTLGAYCIACWATGRYPHWWHGRVFDGPITAWVCNKTAKDVRDINEAELLGPPGNEAERGTGLLPSHLIQRCTPKPGTPHAFEFVNVEHVSGMSSYVVSKSYDQGREAFQGRAVSAIWNDEEVTDEIAQEERLRIMTTSGLLLYTYTPVNGLTEMTMNFLESAGLSIDALRHEQDEVELAT